MLLRLLQVFCRVTCPLFYDADDDTVKPFLLLLFDYLCCLLSPFFSIVEIAGSFSE